jgi:hypothetical protein
VAGHQRFRRSGDFLLSFFLLGLIVAFILAVMSKLYRMVVILI